jgi:hypothetical protein
MEQALNNAAKYLQVCGANAVKIEGGDENIVAVIEKMTSCGIPVVGHIGLLPQKLSARISPQRYVSGGGMVTEQQPADRTPVSRTGRTGNFPVLFLFLIFSINKTPLFSSCSTVLNLFL